MVSVGPHRHAAEVEYGRLLLPELHVVELERKTPGVGRHLVDHAPVLTYAGVDRLNKYVEVHRHVLPGIDIGPELPARAVLQDHVHLRIERHLLVAVVREGEVDHHESAALLGPEVAPKLVREVGPRHSPLDVGHLRRLAHTVLGLWSGLLLSLRLLLVRLDLRLPRRGLLLRSPLSSDLILGWLSC